MSVIRLPVDFARCSGFIDDIECRMRTRCLRFTDKETRAPYIKDAPVEWCRSETNGVQDQGCQWVLWPDEEGIEDIIAWQDYPFKKPDWID